MSMAFYLRSFSIAAVPLFLATMVCSNTKAAGQFLTQVKPAQDAGDVNRWQWPILHGHDLIPLGPVPKGALDGVVIVTGHPYEAQAVTEFMQTLPDGTHITNSATAMIARDSEGRTSRTQTLQLLNRWSIPADRRTDTTYTTIFDPVAKVHIEYNSGAKVAYVSRWMPGARTTPGRTTKAPSKSTAKQKSSANGLITLGRNVWLPVPGGLDSTPSVSQDSKQSNQSDDVSCKTEVLGSKLVEGVLSSGSITSCTIPAGSIGNDKDIVITRELWYSQQLEVIVQSKQNDPRVGQTQYGLKAVQPRDPDRSFFQIPEDYKVIKLEGVR